jgi:hypothetical protein
MKWLRVYSRFPITICTALVLALTSIPIIPWVSTPSPFSAVSSAFAALSIGESGFLTCSVGTVIIMPEVNIPPKYDGSGPTSRKSLPRLIGCPFPFQSSWTHPALESTSSNCRRKSLGSTSLAIVASHWIPENGSISFQKSRNFDGSSILGDLSFANASWASEALAFAFAVSRSNAAIFSPAFSRAKSHWCSLTMPIQTIAMVAAAPMTRLPINTKLARSNIQLAHSNDGHGCFSRGSLSLP